MANACFRSAKIVKKTNGKGEIDLATPTPEPQLWVDR